MNLYGWSFDTFTKVLGSKNGAVLKAATARLAERLEEPLLSNGKAWLTTLIKKGFPLRQDRQPPSVSPEGGLITVQMEGEVHICVVDCIARAIAHDDYLDLALDSSSWQHPAVNSLFEELSACKFHVFGKVPNEYYGWMHHLCNGKPIFGDDFRTTWSYYTYFSNKELAAIVAVFKAAKKFRRSLPDELPEEHKARIRTSLSEGGKRFIGDLIKWFGAIERAGQDALIVWS